SRPRSSRTAGRPGRPSVFVLVERVLLALLFGERLVTLVGLLSRRRLEDVRVLLDALEKPLRLREPLLLLFLLRDLARRLLHVLEVPLGRPAVRPLVVALFAAHRRRDPRQHARLQLLLLGLDHRPPRGLRRRLPRVFDQVR